MGNASRSLATAGFAHPSGTTFGVSVFMGETPARRDVPFSWFGFASVSLAIEALQMMLHCGQDPWATMTRPNEKGERLI